MSEQLGSYEVMRKDNTLKTKCMALSLKFSLGEYEAKVPVQEDNYKTTTLLSSEGGYCKLPDHCSNSEMTKQNLTFYISRMEEEENEGVITVISIRVQTYGQLYYQWC